MFVDHMPDKKFLYRTYKDLLQLNHTNSPIKKWTRDLNRRFSKGDTQRTNKHVKKILTSLVVRKMRIKTKIG